MQIKLGLRVITFITVFSGFPKASDRWRPWPRVPKPGNPRSELRFSINWWTCDGGVVGNLYEAVRAVMRKLAAQERAQKLGQG